MGKPKAPVSVELLDWFAGMALQGLLAHADYPKFRFPDLPGLCWEYADAMIAERAKRLSQGEEE